MGLKTILEDLRNALGPLRSKGFLFEDEKAAMDKAIASLGEAVDNLDNIVRDEVQKELAKGDGGDETEDKIAALQARLDALEGKTDLTRMASASPTKVFSPETDAKTGSENLNETVKKAPIVPPARPETISATVDDQVASATDGTPAAVLPPAGALPGSTGSIAQKAADGSTAVYAGVALDGGASRMDSTISPDQTPTPTMPSTALQATEAAAKPEDADSAPPAGSAPGVAPEVVAAAPETPTTTEQVNLATSTDKS